MMISVCSLLFGKILIFMEFQDGIKLHWHGMLGRRLQLELLVDCGTCMKNAGWAA